MHSRRMQAHLPNPAEHFDISTIVEVSKCQGGGLMGKRETKSRIWVLAVACLCLAPMLSHAADNTTAVRDSLTAFAVEAYSRTEKGSYNFFFSPLSVSIALGPVYGGARGDTEKQLASAMHIRVSQGRYHTAFAELRAKVNNAAQNSRVLLNSAKLLAVDMNYPLEVPFVALTQKKYGSELARLDFGNAPDRARGRINTWVKRQTRGRIERLVEPNLVNKETKIALINAIYFKARWEHEFNERMTRKTPFWITKDRKVNVPTMYLKEELSYGESDTVQVLALPYTGHSISMLIVLPKERDGLGKVENGLTGAHLRGWLGLLAPSHKNRVKVYLPKFKMEMDTNVRSILEGMGATDMFSAEKADLSGISRNGPLFFTVALHRAGVAVDEKGTEAWAATAIAGAVGGRETSPPRPRIFRADHPFLFFIIDETNGVILFMGRLMDPTK